VTGEDGDVRVTARSTTCKSVPVRDAATVLVVRPINPGGELEVLLLRRSMSASFLPGAYVFPGGACDEADFGEAAMRCIIGVDEIAAQQATGSSNGRGIWVTAAREAFEEAGILLAGSDGIAQNYSSLERKGVHNGTLPFAEFLTSTGQLLDGRRLLPWGRWITPQGSHRRFDARFFVALCPEGAQASPDGSETTEARWMTPLGALQAGEAGKLLLITPTRSALQALMRYPSIADVEQRAHLLRAWVYQPSTRADEHLSGPPG
jgi:8-oxo-dGTP pyrophosphatase MutT (NUDIX family)